MKRPISIGILLLSLLVAMQLGGCGKLTPGATGVAHTGSLQLTITVPGQAGMTAQAYELSYVVVTLRNDDDEEITETVEFVNGAAIVNFPVVNPVRWEIEAKAWGDQQGDTAYCIYHGKSNVDVIAGEIMDIELQMELAPGAVEVSAGKPPAAHSGVAQLRTAKDVLLGEAPLVAPASGTYYTATVADVDAGMRDIHIIWKDENETTIATIETVVYILPGRTTPITIDAEG